MTGVLYAGKTITENLEMQNLIKIFGGNPWSD